MAEKTLFLLKPDAVELGLEAVIERELSRQLLEVVRRRKFRLTPAMLREHYAHHADKPYFPRIVAYMTRGPVIALVLEGPMAVKQARNILGATNPQNALPWTLRYIYGKVDADGGIENVAHASENAEDAAKEIARFFPVEKRWWMLAILRLRRIFVADDG